MGADEIRQKIKWHRAIWSPPEHWKLGWSFCVRGSAAYLSAPRINLFAQLFFEGLWGRCYFLFKELSPQRSRHSGAVAAAGLKCMLGQHNVRALLFLPSFPPSHLLPLYTQALQLILSQFHIFIHECGGGEQTALLWPTYDSSPSVSDA